MTGRLDGKVMIITGAARGTGLVTARRDWHDIAGNGSYETEYEYDPLGRLSRATNPVGGDVKISTGIRDRLGQPQPLPAVGLCHSLHCGEIYNAILC